MATIDHEVVRWRHHNTKKTAVFATHALVVLPASMEVRQIALQHMTTVVSDLQELMATSRDEALEFARRSVYHREFWYLCVADMANLATFVQIIVGFNDLQLFNDLLKILRLTIVETDGILRSAIQHFGWPGCIDALVERVRAPHLLRDRVLWFVSVIDTSKETAFTNQLLDALLSLDPWTPGEVDPYEIFSYAMIEPDIDDFARVLVAAERVSPDKLKAAVSVLPLEALVRLAVPSLAYLMAQQPHEPAWRDQLQVALEQSTGLVTKILNAPYEKIQLHKPCALCATVQLFLKSSATETTIVVGNMSEKYHIQEELYRVIKGKPSDVAVEEERTRKVLTQREWRLQAQGPSTLCLQKYRTTFTKRDRLLRQVQQQATEIGAMLQQVTVSN